MFLNPIFSVIFTNFYFVTLELINYNGYNNILMYMQKFPKDYPSIIPDFDVKYRHIEEVLENSERTSPRNMGSMNTNLTLVFHGFDPSIRITRTYSMEEVVRSS